MDNNINFKGAIIIKQPSARIQRLIKPSLGKHHQVLKNFTPDGDVLYIVRKGKDKFVAEFLTHHRINFEYYTDLSTKSGFDNEQPEEARQILNSYKSKIITSIDELKKHFELDKPKIVLPFSNKRSANPIELSVKALGYDLENCAIKKRNGYSEVYDNKGKLQARISGPGQYGISFAFVEPKNADESPLRFALRGGEKIFQYTSESGRAQFLKNYNRAVKANKTVIKTENN